MTINSFTAYSYIMYIKDSSIQSDSKDIYNVTKAFINPLIKIPNFPQKH